MAHVVVAVEVRAVPAADNQHDDVSEFDCIRRRLDTHVGKRIVVRMPPGQDFAGNVTESTVESEQGARSSPPKLAAL